MSADEFAQLHQSTRAQRPPSREAGRLAAADLAATDWPERILFWGLVAGLAWAPAYLGGNAPIFWGVDAMLFPGLALAYEVSLVVCGRSHPVRLRYVAVPAGLFFLVLVWLLLQDATWTPAFLQNPIWSMASQALNRPVAGSISVDRDQTALSLLGLITVGSVFWVTLQLCRDGERANRLLSALAVIGVIYAAYGLAAFVLTPERTLWYDNGGAKGFVTSTFYNKNNYGTYAGIMLCVSFGATLRYYRRKAAEAGVPFKYKLATLLDTTGGGGAIRVACAFVILVSLMMTASRGAIISTTFGIVSIGALGSRSSKRGREQRLTVMISGLLLASVFIGFGDAFLGRITDDGVVDSARLAVAKATIESALNSPLVGWGLGTFADVFPMFRDPSIGTTDRWMMAHNTYVEALQGLGFLFGTFLIVAVGALAAKCLKGATTRYANLTPSRVAVGVSLLVGLHSLVDFSLQIQAVAITYAAILGVGVAQSESSRVDLSD
jgi:hypothetical protein